VTSLFYFTPSSSGDGRHRLALWLSVTMVPLLQRL
jgi:hypothetical protein